MRTADRGAPVIPISYESTEIIQTGKWSSLKPQLQTLLAPCREACPVANDIPRIMGLVTRGRHAEAMTVLLQENPFPGVCSRVCFHPCEAACNRTRYDEAVSVQWVERYASKGVKELWVPGCLPNERPRRIAIIGSGPAGLSCAYFLALLGHYPTVFEARSEPGGVMRWGIPDFRLPKKVLKNEIARILSLPVKMVTNCRVGKDVPFERLRQYDAIFLAPGAGRSVPMRIQGESLETIWNGVEFLERINQGERVQLGEQTLVIGGGNTAMDVARAAIRLGSRATVVYRRLRSAMPAISAEIQEAEEEGVAFEFLLQPTAVRTVPGGKLKMTFQRMRCGLPDETGRPRVEPVDGQYVDIEADSVIAAVGEIPDVSWVPGEIVNEGLLRPGVGLPIFAGGDAVAQPRTVAHAIASAKRAVIAMDLSFQDHGDRMSPAAFEVGRYGYLSMGAYMEFRKEGKMPQALPVVSSGQINTLYFEKSKRLQGNKIAPGKRQTTFREVNTAPDEASAVYSAARCYSCGWCNACYNCFYVCPEGVIKIHPDQKTRTTDLSHCKGCGACVKACPRCGVGMRDLL